MGSAIRDIRDHKCFVSLCLCSSLLNLDELANLPFASQVKVFFTGFAMWETNLTSIHCGE
jgi:hypothetical protein